MRADLSEMREIERLLAMKKLQSERSLRRALDRAAALRQKMQDALTQSQAVLDEERIDDVQMFDRWRENRAQAARISLSEITALEPDILILREATRRATRQLIVMEQIVADLKAREDLAHEEAEEARREEITQLF